MGRRDKSRSLNLHDQAYKRLNEMQAFGESKKDAIANGTDKDKIFSFNTYQTYFKHVKYFIKWLEEKHPEVTTLKKARKYANEWLQERVDQGLSAWTIQTEAKAIGKLFGITPEDRDYFEPPKRVRSQIKRSRGDRVRDKHFSLTNNDELIKFCQGTGLRRSELEELRGRDLIPRSSIEKEFNDLQSHPERTPQQSKRMGILQDALAFNEEFFVHVRNGKGGRERYSPIIGTHADGIVSRIRETDPDEKVWQHVHTLADIHSYRGDYATKIYKKYARDISEIPYDRVHGGTGKKFQSDVYVCRKDEAGKRLDKKAMKYASKALGHNRIEVVANNYIRNL